MKIDFAPRTMILTLSAAAAGVLAAVYIAQYGLGLQPCELCHYQRIPYFAALGLGAASFALKYPRAVVGAMGACFAAGAALAAFHVGVEQHWWEGLSSCSAFLDASDITKLAEQIKNGPRARCDDIAWSMFGISMAGYNFIVSIALAAAALKSAFQK